jgi:hypothetical protein
VKKWYLKYKIHYTDGVSIIEEDVFEAPNKEAADVIAKEKMDKDNDPMNGVSRVSFIFLIIDKD